MRNDLTKKGPSRLSMGVGWALSGLCAVVLFYDGVALILKGDYVLRTMASFGFTEKSIPGLGGVLILGVLLYIFPLVSKSGAIILTAWLGGAAADLYRIDNPEHPFYLPIIFIVLIWLGLYLRDTDLRPLK